METECVLSLGDQQWTLPDGTDQLTIGRASNADIRLQADDQISRIHARLRREGGNWTLYDESRNGTGLNGRRITAPTRLTTGDRIHIGRSVITFTKSAHPGHPGQPDQSDQPGPPAAAPQGSAPEELSPAPAAAEPTPAGHLPAEAAPPRVPAEAAPAGHLPAEAAPEPHPAVAAPAPSPEAAPLPDNPFAPPNAPGDDGSQAGRPAAQADPYAPADQPAPNSSPFAPTDQPAPNGSPFAPTDQPAPNGSPFAPTDQPAPNGSPFAPAGDPAAEGSPVAEGKAGAAGIVPGFEEAPGRGAGDPWAAYPSADGPEPVRSPLDRSVQLDHPDANWNESAGWPDPSVADVDRRTADRRSGRARRSTGRDRSTTDSAAPAGTDAASTDAAQFGNERSTASKQRLPGADERTDEVGTVRLLRVLIAAGGIIAFGLIVNLVVTFFADGPGGLLRWLVPPVVALIVAMVLTLMDAASTRPRPPQRLDVPGLVAIAVVLVGVGVGGFALTAGAKYVGGYLSGNESGADRLVAPIGRTMSGITVTVENVTYTSHFTRVEVKLTNAGKQAVKIPIDGTTFAAADGTALHADSGRSAWPSQIPANGTAEGTITFKGQLPDSATSAVLTFKSGDSAFTVPKIALSN